MALPAKLAQLGGIFPALTPVPVLPAPPAVLLVPERLSASANHVVLAGRWMDLLVGKTPPLPPVSLFLPLLSTMPRR